MKLQPLKPKYFVKIKRNLQLNILKGVFIWQWNSKPTISLYCSKLDSKADRSCCFVFKFEKLAKDDLVRLFNLGEV